MNKMIDRRFTLSKEEDMGEIRAKVKLTNAGDEALCRRGQLEQDRVRTYEADAFVDS